MPTTTTTTTRPPASTPTPSRSPKKDKNNDKGSGVSIAAFALVSTFLVGVIAVAIQSTTKPKVPIKSSRPPWQRRVLQEIILETPQQELDVIREALLNNTVTESHADKLPADVNSLMGKDEDVNEDPIVRAASWLVNKDPLNDQNYLVRRFALATLYYHNAGSQWNQSTNWLSDKHYCEWYGVECCSKYLAAVTCHLGVDENEIVNLDWYKNKVTGTIHDVFALLTDLRTLFLSANSMTGPINGPALSSLPKLLKLYMQHNQFNGTIPNTLRQNGLLDTLFVQGNDLTGDWPKELCPRCPTCSGMVSYFGVDCEEVNCPESCCRYWEHCFYGNDGPSNNDF